MNGTGDSDEAVRAVTARLEWSGSPDGEAGTGKSRAEEPDAGTGSGSGSGDGPAAGDADG